MTVLETRLEAPSPLSLTVLSRTAGIVAGVSADHKLRIWNTRTRAVTHTLDVAGREAAFLAISEDGRLLMLADYASRLTVWNTTTARVQWTLKTPRYLTAATFSRDGKLVAVAPGAVVQVYDLATHNLVRQIESTAGTSAVAFSRDNLSVAATDAVGTSVYDVPTKKLWTKNEDFLNEPLAVEFALDGKSLFAGGGDGVVVHFDARSGEALGRSETLSDPVFYLETSIAGGTIAAVTLSADDPTRPTPVVFFDVASLEPTSKWIPPSGVLLPGATWSSDGTFLAVTQSPRTLHIWSIQL